MAECDAPGRRATATTASGTVRCHYDRGRVAYLGGASGLLLMSFTYGPAGPLTLTYQGQTYFSLTNAHGDVLGLTDVQGAVAAWYRYDAWGRVLAAGGALAQPAWGARPGPA